MASAIQRSSEYRTDVVAIIYLTDLHRPADAPGLSAWVFSGLDLSGVLIGIESSPEYYTNG